MSRLSRSDWSEVALAALAEGGVRAVAVEPLAARLGASKGSFYWHFGSRADLVDAALQLWEQRSTLSVIEDLEASDESARVRLRQLFDRAFALHDLTNVELSLMASAGEEPVRTVVRRVAERRIAYVTALLIECGLDDAIARRRAAYVYTAFLGNLHLMRSSPDLLRDTVGRLDAYADEVLDVLVADTE